MIDPGPDPKDLPDPLATSVLDDSEAETEGGYREIVLSDEEKRQVVQHWAQHGPQGPLDAEDAGSRDFDPFDILPALLRLPQGERLEAADRLARRDFAGLVELLERHGEREAAEKVRAAAQGGAPC